MKKLQRLDTYIDKDCYKIQVQIVTIIKTKISKIVAWL